MDDLISHLSEQSNPADSAENTGASTPDYPVEMESKPPGRSRKESLPETSAGALEKVSGVFRPRAGRPPKSVNGDRDAFVQKILMVPPGYVACDKRVPLSKRADRLLNLLAQEADYLNTHATKQQILDNLLQFVFEQHHELLIQLYRDQQMRTDQETGFDL